MEFRLDPTLTHIAIKEPALYELFQSSRPVVPADKQISAGMTESYICSEKEKNSLKIYLAFCETSRKITRIYTPHPQPSNNREYQNCIEQACTFMTELGFTMEQVNLNYGTAMRQVIWGAVKAFKAPKVYAKSDTKKKSLETVSSSGNAADSESERISDSAEAPEDASALEQEKYEERKLQKKTNVQIRSHEDDKTEPKTQKPAKTEQVSTAARKTDSETGVDAAEYEHKIQKLSEELRNVRSLLSAREAELQRGVEKMQMAEKTTQESQILWSGRIKSLEVERDSLNAELSGLKANVSDLETVIADSTAKYEKLSQGVERKISEERELREIAEKKLMRLAQEKEQIERVAVASHNASTEEREELIERIEAIEFEKQSMKEEFDREVSELRISEEKSRAEAAALSKELSLREEVTAREHAALRRELRRVVEEQSADGPRAHRIEAYRQRSEAVSVEPVSRPAVASCSVRPQEERASGNQGKSAQLPVESLDDRLSFRKDSSEPWLFEVCSNGVDTQDSEDSRVPGEPDAGPTEFLQNRTLKTVPCLTAENLVVLYEPQNKVQTVPEGFKIQKSGGYICAVNCNGKKEIFLIWQLLESRQAIIFTPRWQPGDEESFNRILQDALFYFDSIGFMMSPVNLSEVQSRDIAISSMRLPQS